MKKIYRIFIVAFICLMLVIISTIIPEVFDKTVLLYSVVLVSILGICFLISRKMYSDRIYLLISICVVSVMFILQLLFILKGPYIPTGSGDYEAIYTGVTELVNYGKFTDSNWYYICHPHQLFSTVIYSIINRIFSYLGSENVISNIATNTVNALFIDIGALLIYFCVKRISNSRAAFLSTILTALNISYYGAVKYMYPYVLSVVFCCLILFYMNSIDAKDSYTRRIIKSILLGGSIALAKSVEGILLLSLVAVIICIFVTKSNVKVVIINLSGILLGFVILSLSITGIYQVLNILDRTNENDQRFPYTHWIAMGLSDTGMFQQDDFDAMIQSETKEDKLEYTYNAIRDRLSSRSLSESIGFFYGKEKTVWVSRYYGLWLIDIDHNAYNTAYRFLLYLMILVSTITYYFRDKKKEERDDYASTYIWVTGIFLFILVWEASPVYLFSSMPVLVYAASRAFDINPRNILSDIIKKKQIE